MFEYFNYLKIFFFDLTIELPKNTGINKDIIIRIVNKQLFYTLIYTLNIVELETLKTYIETNQKTGFI